MVTIYVMNVNIIERDRLTAEVTRIRSGAVVGEEDVSVSSQHTVVYL